MKPATLERETFDLSQVTRQLPECPAHRSMR